MKRMNKFIRSAMVGLTITATAVSTTGCKPGDHQPIGSHARPNLGNGTYTVKITKANGSYGTFEIIVFEDNTVAEHWMSGSNVSRDYFVQDHSRLRVSITRNTGSGELRCEIAKHGDVLIHRSGARDIHSDLICDVKLK